MLQQETVTTVWYCLLWPIIRVWNEMYTSTAGFAILLLDHPLQNHFLMLCYWVWQRFPLIQCAFECFCKIMSSDSKRILDSRGCTIYPYISRCQFIDLKDSIDQWCTNFFLQKRKFIFRECEDNFLLRVTVNIFNISFVIFYFTIIFNLLTSGPITKPQLAKFGPRARVCASLV